VGGTEPVTVPRHTRVRSVRSYWRMPERVMSQEAVAEQAAAEAPAGPSQEERAKSRVAVTAVARRGSESRTVMLTGRDPYGLTALLIVRGYEALCAGEARGTGALAPAEAFDVHAFLPRLARAAGARGELRAATPPARTAPRWRQRIPKR